MTSGESNHKGLWRSVKDTFKSNHMFLTTFIIFVFVNVSIFVLAAIFPEWDYKYLEDLAGSNCASLGTCALTPEHLLGTNILGFDNLICLINGAKSSLIIGYGAAAISVPLAVLVGTLGGYKGGIWDNILTMVTNIVLVLPVVSIYMMIAVNIGPQDTATVILLIGFLTWPWAARSIRSQVLSLKEREFVNVARVTGAGSMKIAFKEIMPNMLSYILLVFAMEVVIAIGTEAGLTIIGVAQPTGVTLGLMLQWALTYSFISYGIIRPDIYYVLWLSPGLVLLLIIMVIYFLQASMPQMFNPRLREK
jgi:peptide/nickel transport system permease protein